MADSRSKSTIVDQELMMLYNDSTSCQTDISCFLKTNSSCQTETPNKMDASTIVDNDVVKLQNRLSSCQSDISCFLKTNSSCQTEETNNKMDASTIVGNDLVKLQNRQSSCQTDISCFLKTNSSCQTETSNKMDCSTIVDNSLMMLYNDSTSCQTEISCFLKTNSACQTNPRKAVDKSTSVDDDINILSKNSRIAQTGDRSSALPYGTVSNQIQELKLGRNEQPVTTQTEYSHFFQGKNTIMTQTENKALALRACDVPPQTEELQLTPVQSSVQSTRASSFSISQPLAEPHRLSSNLKSFSPMNTHEETCTATKAATTLCSSCTFAGLTSNKMETTYLGVRQGTQNQPSHQLKGKARLMTFG